MLLPAAAYLSGPLETLRVAALVRLLAQPAGGGGGGVRGAVAGAGLGQEQRRQRQQQRDQELETHFCSVVYSSLVPHNSESEMSNFSFKIVFIGTGFPSEGGYSVEYRHYYSRVLTQHTLVVTLHPGDISGNQSSL